MDAVLDALRGESLLVIRPTGGGKSLCFQLPAILKGRPTAFVLSPLKTLMVNQTHGLHGRKPGAIVVQPRDQPKLAETHRDLAPEQAYEYDHN